MIRSLPVLVSASLLLAACSTVDGQFPSLAKRPFETQNPVAEPASPVPSSATALPADLASKVNAMMARHAKAQAAFAGALPAMRSLANNAAGGSTGSDAWIEAQEDLSRLDKLRADSVAVQGELDQLVIEKANAETNSSAPSLLELLAPYQGQVSAAVGAQTAEIERLAKLLGD